MANDRTILGCECPIRIDPDLEFAGGVAPSPRGGLDESKDYQTNPEVHHHPEVESRGHVPGSRRQIRPEQEIDGIACQDRHQGVSKIRGTG
jgi:hypothetical protein